MYTHTHTPTGVVRFYSFLYLSLTADGPQRARLPIQTNPTHYCNAAILLMLVVSKSLLSVISPFLAALRIFIAMQVQQTLLHLPRQPMVESDLLTHVLTLSATEERIKILVLTRIELTTSSLAGVRGYLLDHSGDGYGEVSGFKRWWGWSTNIIFFLLFFFTFF